MDRWWRVRLPLHPRGGRRDTVEKVWGGVLAVGLAAVSLLSPPAGAAEQPALVPRGDDVSVPLADDGAGLSLQETDPLGLLVGIDTLQDHSLGTDVLDVWTCGTSESVASVVDRLRTTVGPYFRHHSNGRYEPQFIGRGYAGGEVEDCEEHSRANASPSANGALHIAPGDIGTGSPGWTCGFSPCSWSEFYGDDNGRSAFIGSGQVFESTAAHEMGHMLQWPHSFTGARPVEDQWREYDNAIDVMSGNFALDDGHTYSFPDPYATAAINLYAAGWIDPFQVYVFPGGDGAEFSLTTVDGTGYRMAVIGGAGGFFALGPRVPSAYDPIPDYWTGVEVYEVTVCSGESECMEAPEMRPGFRRVTPSPPESFDIEGGAGEEPLPHVIPKGDSRSVGGVQVRVISATADGFQVSIGPAPQPIPDPPPSSPFADTWSSIFIHDIVWLADAGITRGCNPPDNSLFCAEDPVTRGQMAAFLHRALPGIQTGPVTEFVDDDESLFESDIEWLGATGVTRGCNPPSNDRFCPDDLVTRGQMAAFLHRALPGLETGSVTDFVDDDGSQFESDIEWLAATGVTRGCNPPSNDRFCPDAPVTRGAMAAFLHRALGG